MTEHQHREWKTSWRDEYLKWICGFANAQGGVLEIGRNDRGEVVGVQKALISYDGIYRTETFPVPRSAMREAVVNAVVHRDYQDPATIQIRVYGDRIEIWNPAELPPGWTAAPAGGALPSRPFNPRIAYAFFRAGMIEAWGRGLRRIRDACDAAGIPTPEWESSGGGLWLRFRFSRAYLEAEADTPGDHSSNQGGQSEGRGDQGTGSEADVDREKATQKTPELPRTTTQKHTETTQKTPELPKTTTRKHTESPRNAAQEILRILRGNPIAGRREIAAELAGITEDGVKYHLDRLKADGRIRRVGPPRGGRWEIVDSPDG